MLLAMKQSVKACSAEIVVLEARKQESDRNYNDRIAELHNEIIAEQKKSEEKVAVIEAVNTRVQAILVEQTAQIQRYEATKQQLMSDNHTLQNEVAMAKSNFQRQQAKVEELENQISINAAAQITLQQQMEEEKRQLQQVLETQIANMVAQHASEIQHEIQQKSAQIKSFQQNHQQELNQRLQASQAQMNHLQEQINAERLRKEQLQAQINNLQNQLANQQQICNTSFQRIESLSQDLRNANANVTHLERKVHKAKKSKWKFWK